MEYVQLTLDDYIQCKTEIKENLCGIVKGFVRIGWQLTRINNSEAYKLDGYGSITEFAKAEYDMNPDGVSRFMNVYERYSVPGDSPELKEQYRDFKFAQLSEMLQLSEEDQAMIQPGTKRADIRELKKFNKENENNPEGLLNWKAGQQDKVSETIVEFYRASKEVLNDLYSSEAYQTGNTRRMAEIVNPSGNRSFRKGTVFLMMYGYDKGITVKQIPQGVSSMAWDEFFSITQALFAEAAAGDRTYDNYFNPEGQKTAQEEKSQPASEDAEAQPEFAPAQNSDEKKEIDQKTALPGPEPAENTQEERSGEEQDKEEPREEQVPGQDTIMNHPEYMPPADGCKDSSQEKDLANPQGQPEEKNCAGASGKKVEEKTAHGNMEDVIPDKPATRKEYMDSLTLEGTAEYLAEAMKSFDDIPWNEMQERSFWGEWLKGKVDHSGRTWID